MLSVVVELVCVGVFGLAGDVVIDVCVVVNGVEDVSFPQAEMKKATATMMATTVKNRRLFLFQSSIGSVIIAVSPRDDAFMLHVLPVACFADIGGLLLGKQLLEDGCQTVRYFHFR